MIIVLGSFDGFHKGHQSLFTEAIRLASKSGTPWAVMTFSPHPNLFFSPEKAKLLFTEEEKTVISRYLEIPQVITIPFNEKLASLQPEQFLDKISNDFPLTGIVVGDNFKFGRGRTGNIDFLQNYASRKDLFFSHVSPIKVSGTIISSTMIRGLVSCGEVMKVTDLLGYDFFITGKVIKGDMRGRKLGYPTANLYRDPNKAVPAEGVYASAVFMDERWWPSAVNIGYNPTFSTLEKLRIEAHILDFIGDIYGKTIHLAFLKRLRGELAFRTIEELRHQIRNDADLTRRVYENHVHEHQNFFSLFSNAIQITTDQKKVLPG